MWRKKRNKVLKRRQGSAQDQLPEEPVNYVPEVAPLNPDEPSALRQIYLRKKFHPPKYNFEQILRERTEPAMKSNAPDFANTKSNDNQSHTLDLDSLAADVLMWEPDEDMRRWQSLPTFHPVVMPMRNRHESVKTSGYQRMIDSTVRQWRLKSFKDTERLRNIESHLKSQERKIRLDHLKREDDYKRIKHKRPASASDRLKGQRKRKSKRHLTRKRPLTSKQLLKALDLKLLELDQTNFSLDGYERERAGIRRRPRSLRTLPAHLVETNNDNLKKRKKKKKKKKNCKKNQATDDNNITLDSRTEKRRQRRKSVAERLLRIRRTLAITADDLSKSNKLREVFLDSACQSVNADKGSFWVFDEAPFELWSYSGKGEDQILRVAANQGIVGQCFTQGSAMIIHDAYKVRHFSAKMDKRTGYTTKTLMCIPVHGEDQIFDKDELRTNLGCIQLLNKNGLEGMFNTRDATIVQLQLIVLRSYLRSFRDTDSINSNLPRLEYALKILCKSTEGEDEAALKVRFSGLAKEFGNFKDRLEPRVGNQVT